MWFILEDLWNTAASVFLSKHVVKMPAVEYHRMLKNKSKKSEAYTDRGVILF